MLSEELSGGPLPQQQLSYLPGQVSPSLPSATSQPPAPHRPLRILVSIKIGGLQSMLLRALGFPGGPRVSKGIQEEAEWERLPLHLHSKWSHFLLSILHTVLYVTFILTKALCCFNIFLNLRATQNFHITDGETEALSAVAGVSFCSLLEIELGSVPD